MVPTQTHLQIQRNSILIPSSDSMPQERFHHVSLKGFRLQVAIGHRMMKMDPIRKPLNPLDS